ncbi:MAG: hypothetical protein JWM87_530 [Candidatus Eremiobacteraeota bacterium]|nr:hypothetical protein [Candidatus Eremiobacteraeota bacterium]
MFDRLGWEHHYEPYDLSGWIPDFVITGNGPDLLVEVKPTFDFYKRIGEKIYNSGAVHEALFLFAGLRKPEGFRQGATPGYLAEDFRWLQDHPETQDAPDWCWGPAVFVVDRREGARYDIIHGEQNFDCRVHGGHMYGDPPWDIAPMDEIAALWADAGNTVQYRKPK